MVSTFPNSHSVDQSQIRLNIRALQPQLVEWRRRLHQRPELGFQEQLTAQLIAQKLKEWGIDHHIGIAKTGIVATITGNKKRLATKKDQYWRFGQIWMLCQFKNKTMSLIGHSTMVLCMLAVMMGILRSRSALPTIFPNTEKTSPVL